MRYVLQIGLFFTLFVCAGAQPAIQWQKSFGGSKKDSAREIRQTSDGGYVLVGYSSSLDGDISDGIGGGDWWILKISSTGQKIWEKSFGGTSTESAYDIVVTDDSGFVLIGETYSSDVDVSENHGEWDIWIVRLDSLGNIQWEKSYGGSNSEGGYSIKQTADLGFIFCGNTNSNDGDISQSLGFEDVWVVKIDKHGIIEWQRTYGGFDGDETSYCIETTDDGGYIFTGETTSSDGDITEALGNTDAWVVKLNNFGEIQWQRTLGGFASDRSWDVKQDNNGSFFVVGYWGSGDIIPNWHGLYDYWITKLDANGNIVWSKVFGGTKDDWARTIGFFSNGDMVIAGATRSVDGDVTQNDGIQDIWLVGIDSSGSMLWEKSIGGNGPEIAFDLLITSEQDVVLTGESSIVSGDVTQNQGSVDLWVVKLSTETSSTTTPSAIPLNLYPNPAQNWFRLNLPITEPEMQISITDAQGRVVLAKTIRSDERLDVAALEPGVYGVSALAQSGQVYAGKLVKE
jgi:hypothetical protein